MRISKKLLWCLLTLTCPVALAEPPPPPNVETPASFRFNKKDYQIGRARIFASLADPYWCDTYNRGQGKSLAWTISIDAKLASGQPGPPSVEFDGIEVTVGNWQELVGYRTRWTDPINPKTDDRYGLTYSHNHLFISKGEVKIVHRKGTVFRVVARGQDEEGQTFTIDAPAEFVGIYVRGSETDTNASILARLKNSLKTDNLTGSDFKLNFEYNSGVKAGQAFFRPKPESSASRD